MHAAQHDHAIHESSKGLADAMCFAQHPGSPAPVALRVLAQRHDQIWHGDVTALRVWALEKVVPPLFQSSHDSKEDAPQGLSLLIRD